MKYLISKYFKDDSLKYPMYKVLDTDNLEVTLYKHDELLRQMGRVGNLVLGNVTKKDLYDNKVQKFSFDYVSEDLAKTLNGKYGDSSKFVIPLQDMVENIPIEYKSLNCSIFMYRKKTILFKEIVLFFYEKLYIFRLNRHIVNRDTAEIHLPIVINSEKEVIVRQFDAVVYGYDSTEDTFNIFFCSVLGSTGYIEGFGLKVHKDGLVEVIDGGVIDTYQNDGIAYKEDFKRAALSVKRKQIFD